MKIQFFKYQGTGNDFIIIDNRTIQWEPAESEISGLCDRHTGIGADGLMLLGDMAGFDFAMRYFNSDGKESTMCGNGGRCMTAFARHLALIDTRARFWAVDGSHEAEFTDPVYRLKMKDTRLEILFEDGYLLNTGSPHFVVFTHDVAGIDVSSAGRALRNDDRFAPDGVNVDFVESGEDGLFVRTYERGVEGETLSCGTGVTAAAIIAAYLTPGNREFYQIKTLGGNLRVSFRQSGLSFSDVWLEGPALQVFQGEFLR
ncbi:MAG: diaminopimelate epimerase [Bacteroidota bacterium]